MLNIFFLFFASHLFDFVVFSPPLPFIFFFLVIPLFLPSCLLPLFIPPAPISLFPVRQTAVTVTLSSPWCATNLRASNSSKPRPSSPGRSSSRFTEASKTYENRHWSEGNCNKNRGLGVKFRLIICEADTGLKSTLFTGTIYKSFMLQKYMDTQKSMQRAKYCIHIEVVKHLLLDFGTWLQPQGWEIMPVLLLAFHFISDIFNPVKPCTNIWRTSCVRQPFLYGLCVSLTPNWCHRLERIVLKSDSQWFWLVTAQR